MKVLSRLIVCCLVASLLLTACTPAPTPTTTSLPAVPATPTQTLTPAPSATPAPTQPPSATPTAADLPARPLDPAQSGLPGALWTWTGSTLADGRTFKPADPLRYTLEFGADGALKTQADCNQANGSYTLTGADGLALDLGAMTKMACLPPSLAVDFTYQLGLVSTYALDGTTLTLTLRDAGGTMRFAAELALDLPEPPDGGLAALANGPVPVRYGPDAKYPLYGVMTAGTRAEVVGKYTPWWALRLPTSPYGVGWVRQADVQLENGTDAPSLPPLAADFGSSFPLPGLDDPQVIVTDPGLGFSGPGINFTPTISGLPGQIFFVMGLSQDGDFWKVFVPPDLASGGYAWLPAGSVHASNTDSVPVIAALTGPTAGGGSPLPQPGAASAVASTGLNLRRGPGFTFPVVGQAVKGQVLALTGQTSDGVWLQVQVSYDISSDRRAWVHRDNLYLYNAENLAVVATPLPPYLPVEMTGKPCAVNALSPVYGSLFGPNRDFTVSVELLNNTGKTWSSGNVDLVFLNAIGTAALHTGPDVVDFTQSIADGRSLRVEIPATSPRESGDFSEVWALVEGGKSLCYFTFGIALNPTPLPPTPTYEPTRTGTIEPTNKPDIPPTPVPTTPEPTNPPEVSPTPLWGG